MSVRAKASLLEGPIAAGLWKLSVPIILTNLLQTGYNLTDAFWVGRFGASAVAAVSVSFPLVFLGIALGSGLAMAGATLSAQYMGAGRKDLVNHVAAQSLLMSAAVSIVLSLLGYAAAPLYIHLLNLDPEVTDLAIRFVRVSFVGLPFVFGFIMIQALMRGIGETRLPLIIVGATVFLNFALDPAFMYGWSFIPKFGMVGAAIATVLTQMLSAIFGIASFLRGRHGIHLQLKNFKPDAVYIKRAFLLGYPGSIELAGRALGIAVMSFLVAGFGTLTIAAYGVGSNILQFVMIPAMGIAMAVSTMVGQNMGARRLERAKEAANLGLIASLIALTVLGALSYLFAETLIRFFVPNDANVIAHGAQFIRIMALTWGGIGVQLCVTSTLRASGNMITAMMLALVSQWLVQFPLAYVLSKFTSLGAVGIWWAFPISNVLIALLSYVWFARGEWLKTRLTEESDLVRQTTDVTLIEEGPPRS